MFGHPMTLEELLVTLGSITVAGILFLHWISQQGPTRSYTVYESKRDALRYKEEKEKTKV